MAGLVNVDLGSIVQAGGNILDDLFTSKEEEMTIAIENRKIDASLRTGQMEINKVEAGHRSVFVAGWRPFMGWICGAALGYKFIVYEFFTWLWFVAVGLQWLPEDMSPPPTINAAELYPIIMGLLGLGGLRTIEAVKHVKSESLSSTKPKEKFKWPWQK
jgi:hypothetical protein